MVRKSNYQDNVDLGYQIALQSGLNDSQWNCLYTLGMRESGWNEKATNKSSGAFGIAQSLPASKYDVLGDRYDPAVQVKWMVQYIQSRYQTPCKALAQSFAQNWY